MITARHYRTGQPVRVEIADGRYTAFTPAGDDGGLWIAPGLVDVQVNGFGGVDFNAPGLDDAARDTAATRLLEHGCTHFLPTLLTNGNNELLRQLRALRHAEGRPGARAFGVHLEGPFLNPDPGSRGCHPVEFMRAPDLMWLAGVREVSLETVRLITLAPEVHPEEARDFIVAATAEGIRIAVGHSLAMGEALRAAIEAGATGWTHLGNAAPHLAPKFENVILHALAADGLTTVSLIPDGIHVPPHAFRALARALGPRLVLTTDAMAGAAAPPGRYTLGPVEAEVGTDGRATVPGTDKLAGSTLTPLEGVTRAASMAGLPWQDMWDAFSIRPAAWLGLEHGLRIGLPASFCLLRTEDETLRLEGCWIDGIPMTPAMDA